MSNISWNYEAGRVMIRPIFWGWHWGVLRDPRPERIGVPRILQWREFTEDGSGIFQKGTDPGGLGDESPPVGSS